MTQLSPFDQSYFCGAELARNLGRGWRPQPRPTNIILGRNEYVYAETMAQVQEFSKREIDYQYLSLFHDPFWMPLGIAAAAYEAMEQWRDIDEGRLFFTSSRIAFQGRLGWREIEYSTLRSCRPEADGISVWTTSYPSTLKFKIWPQHWYGVLLTFLAHGQIVAMEPPPYFTP